MPGNCAQNSQSRRRTFGETVIRSVIWTHLALEYKLHTRKNGQSVSHSINAVSRDGGFERLLYGRQSGQRAE